MHEHLNELNSNQKEAVIQKDGPILIIAGAGAGKTKTITHRILHLINEGVAPSSILAVTFTNKASKEMRERVEKMLSSDEKINFPISNQEKPFISTFHSLGVYIIKENSHKLGLNRHFNIFDKNDSKRAVKEALIQNGLDPKQFDPAKILGFISKQKGNSINYEKFKENVGNDYFSQIVSKVWEGYEKTLKKEKALDFDDLLLKTSILLREDSGVRNYYQNKWQYVHIDEYQDTNRVQYEISKLLVGKNQNICVVGDADQCIYSWRGANHKNILNFEKDFSNVKTVVLEENYRSTKNILSAANDVIKKNKIRKEKNLFTNNIEGEKISLFSNYTEKQEADNVVGKIQELLEKGANLNEIAVLYRANFQSRALEEAFLMAGVPYQVLGTKFFDRKEIKDMLSFIKASLNPDSLTDIKRIINVPPRGIGEVTLLKIFNNKINELNPKTKEKVDNFYQMLEKIGESCLKDKPSDVIKFIMKITGIEAKLSPSDGSGTEEDKERLDNIREMVTLAVKYDYFIVPEGLEKMLEDSALATDQDEIDNKNKKDAVKMMTVHASKGLEFDYVFITGLEDSLFPSRRNKKQTEEEKEEERRLFYVAITRARKKLFLSYASIRMIFGSKQMNPPSEFIFDIKDSLIEDESYKRTEIYGNSDKIIYLDL
ncbi:MAG: UvrD-helicase domain-containing protein [Candidatus Pacebacteria bacterium]|nr:UvrD-helicase domain-containing protein [Candidatus Paceibacterota bacterium]